jgi:hypothetical protein
MSGSTNRRGGAHHHFLGGGRAGSAGFVEGVERASAAAAVAALRLSAPALRALASRPGGLSGVSLAMVAPAATLLAA